MSGWHPARYKTTNLSAYNKALKQRGSLTIWFDPGMTWRPPPTGKHGRQQQLSDAAIQTCLTMKVLFGMPPRQTSGFVESLLQLVGLDWAVPDFSTLCRRQRMLNVSLPYRVGSGPLNLLIDSTRIKAEGEGEWNARKHGGPKRRAWRKIHIGIDEETLEVRAVQVTSSNVGDAPMLPDLLNQIPPDQDIGSVIADGAYDTRKCHEAIAVRGAHAVIPPRKNAKPWKPTSAGAIACNEAVNAQRYLGRTLWRRWSGYHRRSRVETKMHCVKLLGQSLMARDFERQVAEIQIRIAALNRYTALGIPVTEPVG
ncbi:IS5 family transposase [Jannaschia sp. M317]|uniref:IS5 family transposase n=1 Tax=Jannaschia sp. M317 TaxID=2867011 RepID=UPI0021A27B4B|nr:IS5 family transposase [Jannaschia sp. M317]UWQ17725.1 IS5 family transposase [Jannaschia sp. M317]